MSSEIARRPSPATLIAMVALVAALGGTAQALPGTRTVDDDDLQAGSVSGRALQKASVGNHKLKDGAVTDVKIADGSVHTAKIADLAATTQKLAEGAVTGAKIADDGVKGADVDESSLGEVPSANTAKTVSFLKQFNVRLSFGDDVEVVSNGPISVRARCVLNGTIDGAANRDGIQLYARSTAPGSFMDGSSDDRFGDTNGDGLADNESLDPGDAIDDSTLHSQTTPGGAPDEESVNNQIDIGFVASRDGQYIGIDAEETLFGVRVMGSDCVTIGMAQLQG